MNNSATIPLPLGNNLPSLVNAAKTQWSSASQRLHKYKGKVSQYVMSAKEARRLKNQAKMTPIQEAFAYAVAVALEEAYPIYGNLCTREYIKSETLQFHVEEETLRLASEEVKNSSPYLLQVATVPASV